MIRNALLLLSSSVILVACGQGRSQDGTAEATKTAPDADIAESVLVETAEAPADIPALPDIVAKGGGIEITGADLAKSVDPLIARYRAMGAIGNAAQLAQATRDIRKDILDKMVLQRLLLREAAAKNISATEAEADAFIKERLPEGVTLEAVAAQQGVTVEDIRKDVLDNLGIEKFLETLFDDFEATTDEAAKAEYDKMLAENPDVFKTPESVQASHILVKVEKGADDATKEAARKKIEELRQKILDGADFAEVAKENSDCPSSARGGDLGQFRRGQMVKPFEEAAFTQPIGEVGPVVETDFGFHIIKVTGKTEAGEQSFEDLKEKIKEHLDTPRKNSIVSDYLDALRSKAEVETFLPEIKIPEPPAEEPAARPLPSWAE